MSQHITHPPSQPPGRPPIGAHFTFSEGQFAGRTICVELHELQKADVGRKYIFKDRRPLDPPPVAQMKLFETVNPMYVPGTEFANYKDVKIIGLLCHVDLFAVHSTAQTDAGPSIPLRQNASRVSSISPPPLDVEDHASPLILAATSNATQSEVLTHVDGHPITEQSNCTTALAGSTVIEATSLEWKGRDTLMYIFSVCSSSACVSIVATGDRARARDLSVRQEGTFILRYRVFDVMSRARGHVTVPVLAECYGGSFKVFPPKLFPGLQPSTELTTHLARYGVRLNVRETERRKPKSSGYHTQRNVRIAPASSPGHSQNEPGSSVSHDIAPDTGPKPR
ncbi:uncharacterized protein LAESUDRAFT_275128 [Laetiporus sulphureus 93-53]|uniref:Velvet domain-containing protein n=1 Tax=Laetiporus sulphureus 93-53 TaxID=1314785 RepID=A0A165HBY5_9APHY|nr:uncharacterized protein LAESUDRAFT_275128 [Laetiporus sulphureus 93-53]KZT11527.1 hypothetical protein LAESUDRAFT_275128 [Laetiporus sulphureus 93-53]